MTHYLSIHSLFSTRKKHTLGQHHEILIGNDNVQRKQYNVNNLTFHSIHINGTVDVHFTQADGRSKIDVETDENLHHSDVIRIFVDSNNCLNVEDHNCQYTKMIVHIRVQGGTLKSLSLNGTGLVRATNELSAAVIGVFTIYIGGTRKVLLTLEAANGLDLQMNGTAQLALCGHVRQTTTIKQGGTTQLNAEECRTSRVTTSLQGTSTAYIVAQDEIKVNVQGVSKLFYRGPLREKVVGGITCKGQQF